METSRIVHPTHVFSRFLNSVDPLSFLSGCWLISCTHNKLQKYMTNPKYPSPNKSLRKDESPPTISFISATVYWRFHGHVSCCHYNSPDPVMCSMRPTIERGFIDLLNPFSAKLTLTLHALKGDAFKPPNKIPRTGLLCMQLRALSCWPLRKHGSMLNLLFHIWS